jgi:hypothetical protein
MSDRDRLFSNFIRVGKMLDRDMDFMLRLCHTTKWNFLSSRNRVESQIMIDLY